MIFHLHICMSFRTLVYELDIVNMETKDHSTCRNGGSYNMYLFDN